MAKHTMDMVLEYAKVFAENRDMGSDLNNAAKKAARHNGQYVVNAHLHNVLSFVFVSLLSQNNDLIVELTDSL